MKKSNFLNVSRLSRIAILSALAFLLMFFEFPLTFIAPSFYKLDFSELPVLIGGFSMGPFAAVMIEFLKIILHLLFKGTQTAFVGEVANFVVGCALVCPATILYQKKPSRRQLEKALALGGICMVIVGFALNMWLVIPAYVQIMHFPLEAIIGAGKAIFSSVNSVFTLVIFCTTPFNIIKVLLVSIFTVLLLPHVETLLKQNK